MTAQDHRLAASRQRENQILHLAAADGIQARRRFVEDDEIGIVDERLREPDAALHAFGKFPDRARLRLVQADHFEQLPGAIVPVAFGEFKQVAEKIQRLARVEVAVEIRFLRQITDARLGLHMTRRFSKDLNVPLRRIQQTQQQLDRRGFAGTIRPEQPKHLAASHLKIHIVHGARLRAAPEIFEHLRQPAHGHDDFAAGLWTADCGLRSFFECGHKSRQEILPW